jgi:hypothetical protein
MKVGSLRLQPGVDLRLTLEAWQFRRSLNPPPGHVELRISPQAPG